MRLIAVMLIGVVALVTGCAASSTPICDPEVVQAPWGGKGQINQLTREVDVFASIGYTKLCEASLTAVVGGQDVEILIAEYDADPADLARELIARIDSLIEESPGTYYDEAEKRYLVVRKTRDGARIDVSYAGP